MSEGERDQLLASFRAKTARGDRPTREERKAVWAKLSEDLLRDKVNPAIEEKHFVRAVRAALVEMAAHFLAVADRADGLEDRIEALEAGGIRFKGIWQRACEYTRGEVVIIDGSSWIALRTTKPNEKPADGDGWHLMAAKGERGRDARGART